MKHWKGIAGGVACTLTVPLALGGAPVAHAAGAGGGAEAPLALVGELPGDVSLNNARFTVRAQPASEIDEAVNVGEVVPSLELPAELVKVEGNEFSLGVRPADLGDRFIGSDGLATVSVEVYLPDTNSISVTMASLRLVDGKSWSDPNHVVETAKSGAGVRAAAPVASKPVRVKMKPHPLPSAVTKKATRSAAARSAGDVGTQSAIERLLKTSNRTAVIGATYPIGDQKASMFHGSNRAITYGAAVNYSSWTASGSKSISNGYEFTWASKKSMRSHRTQVRYGLYSHMNKDGIELYRTWRPIVETGVTGEATLSSRPTWNKKAAHCGTLPTGSWSRTSSSGKSYSLAGGVKIKKVIGIDLSTNRNYASNSKLTYNLSSSTRKLCGNNEKPGLAGKIAQYRN
ncbi:hypothetical protein QNO07_10465 [Streptomyces sp. 549]|uniref:hypothetical protein n=1 Tax=Streptomyces sp. 549 TaxID=3049076 RepID=UPI0024C407C1|nr:hypothetical protein [Streptomyces sp. 549]MDK1473838.1 hypothetical protein [Streptomyces sp. 549]